MVLTPLSSNALITTDQLIRVIKANGAVQIKDPNDPTSTGFDETDEDFLNYLIGLINQVSSQVESYLGRKLGKATYSELARTSFGDHIQVENYPIVKINEVRSLYGNTMPLNRLEFYNDYRNYEKGLIETGGMLKSVMNRVGMGNHPQNSKPAVRINYEAGYVLPKDATDTVPATLPEDIQSVVTSACVKIFIRYTDDSRAQDLISLTEGNVVHQWASTTTKDMKKYGALDLEEQNLLNKYRRAKGLYTV